jgi:hypothetical protein
MRRNSDASFATEFVAAEFYAGHHPIPEFRGEMDSEESVEELANSDGSGCGHRMGTS